MSKLNISIFVNILILISFSSCQFNKIAGNGDIISKEISISDYKQIFLKGENIEFKYIQSEDTPFLKIETDQNIMDTLDILSDKEQLIIRPKNKNTTICPSRLKISTNSTCLNRFELSGHGQVDLDKGLSCQELNLKIAGCIHLTADSINVNHLHADAAGSNHMYLSGTSEQVSIYCAGSNELKAFNLRTDTFSNKSAGSSHIEITANKSISIQLAGNGTVLYKGNPDILKKEIAGSGTITKVD